MENLINGRREKLPLTSREAMEIIRGLRIVSDPDERERIGEDLSSRLNFPALVNVLHELFGRNKELIEISGVSDKKTIREWSHGIVKPHSLAVSEQFRLTLKVCVIISDSQNPDIYRSWFNSLNPSLDDRSPLELLRQRDFRGVSKSPGQLLSAAKDFQRTPVIS